MQENNPKIMLLGDLNADPATLNGVYLKEFAFVNNLFVHINSPTRITERTSTILDQCMSNFPPLVKETCVSPPISTNDHCTIEIKCLFRSKKPRAYKRVMWDFKNANFTQYRSALADTDWTECFQSNDINVICEQWTSKVLSIAKSTIPNKIVTVRPRDKPWYNSHLRRLKRHAIKLFNSAKHINTADSWTKYKQSFYHYQCELSCLKLEYEQSKYDYLCQEGQNNPKKWWSLLKQINKNNYSSDTIPPIELNNVILTDDADKAEAFNDFFLSVTELDDSNAFLPHEPVINPVIDRLEFIEITATDINDQLGLIDVSKAYGPDEISPRLLKEGGNPMSSLLLNLFNMSLVSSKFPSLWKKANVIPIHKKDSKADANNYRPVSLLSSVGKLFEKIVFKYVYNYFRDNFIISINQSGFLPGRSTVTQLLEIYHQFCNAVDSNKEIRVVFLDISKAFDKVWHKGILYKLSKCGIGGNLLLWFQDYLKDRLQRVVINGQHSNWGKISAGVPQGSVLGPLLFLLYINDLTQCIHHCNIRLFADDTCLFIEVDNREEAALFINKDLADIVQWSRKWLVTFQPVKTKSLIVSNKKDAHLNPPVYINNQVIDEVPSHKHLGIYFASNLKWNLQIHEISIKARKRLNAMIPLKFKLNCKSLEIMYNSFVLPVMEYANTVWGGSYDSDLNKLERIHVDGMRLISGATAKSNISKLYKETAWLSIKERRDNAMLLMMFKIKNHLAPDYLKHLVPLENKEHIGYNLRNNANIPIPFSRLESVKRSFFPACIRLWNRVPIENRILGSVSSFRNSLHKNDRDTNILFYYGERWASVHHARLRLGCSKLNYDLHSNLHVIDDASCRCGAPIENARHYFLKCPLFHNARINLIQDITKLTTCNFNHILYGDTSLTLEQNKLLFGAVHRFIVETQRFN
jgi:hypothetical protein